MKMNSIPFPRTLIIGSSGFIGQGLVKRWESNFNKKLILTPSETELNILNLISIQDYISENKPDVIINLAAMTNLEEAEKERGDKKGLAWKLNTEAPKNLAKICKKLHIFLIQMSTDAVFPGTFDTPGPYRETVIPPKNLKPLSWYAYTKLASEKAVSENHKQSAIVRISYPFGNYESERDFVRRTIKYIQNGYPLFSDQIFTPTFTDDINSALEVIVKNRPSGIFHVVCKGLTTPYLFGLIIAERLNLGEVKEGIVVEYLKKPGMVPRPVIGGLTATQTECKLEIKPTNWETALKKVLQNYKP